MSRRRAPRSLLEPSGGAYALRDHLGADRLSATPTARNSAILADLRDAIGRVRDAWAAWDGGALRSAPIAAGRPGGGAGDQGDAGLPALIIALSARREACERVAAWCATILDDAPHGPRKQVSETDMPKMLALIEAHAPWLSGIDEAPVLIDKLQSVARSLNSVASHGSPGSPSVFLGACPFDSCGGDVRLREGERNAKCHLCGKSGSPGEWEWIIVGPRPALTLYDLPPFLKRNAFVDVSRSTLARRRASGAIVPVGTAEPRRGVNKGIPVFDPWAVLKGLLADEECSL